MAHRSDPDAISGPYDPDPDAEEDLWFLPAPPDPDASPADLPWAGPSRPGWDLRVPTWATAEAALAGDLARAALALGALDERVRTGPAGLRQRLVCAEVAELSWHLGDRVTVDRLALYLVLRLAAVGEDAAALARAAWAVRRLDRGGAADLSDLAAFLGRSLRDTLPDADLATRPVGTEFDALARDWEAELADAAGQHPLTRSALAWHGWRRRGLSGDAALLEGAVTAARIGAEALRPGGLGFVPVALGGNSPLIEGGSARARLAAWLRAVEQAALRGLMEADRLSRWEAEARTRTASMSGRIPAQLLAALLAWPLVSAPMLEAETGASRAAVQRNMNRFQDLGLVQEVTGQARFRYWRLAL
ncbi:MAG: hypothetical protein KDA50_04065 [Rhodobacteraceae bacterium]|nr:hypothetical protein [Paracoccaceae bacterium]